MCLWGSARQAKSRGESVYSLDFSIIVWHDDMPVQISQYLSLEMSYVTESVRKVEIPMNDTAGKFPELTDSVKYTSDYILACALICTEHFDEAERILEPLNAQVKAVSRNIPTIANLKHAVPAKLCIVYAIQAEIAYEE